MKADKPIKNRYKGALREGSENYLYGGEYYMYGGEYANGGEVAKYAGSAAYGALEGVLDTVTFGLTDPLTDIGYDALQKAGNKKLDLSDPEDLKQLEKQNKLRGAGNIGGAIAGGVVTGNVPGAIKTGVEGANVIVQNSDVSDKTRQIANTATNITGTVAGFAGAGVGSAGESALDMGLANLAKDADQLGTFTNIAKGAQVGGQAASLIPNKGGLAEQARAIQAEEARQKEMLAQQQVLLDSQDSLVAAGIMPNTVPMQYYGSGGKLGNKIGKLRREGYPQDQAVAIAYSMQERNELGNGGYVVSKSDRKGKTHKVTGPDGSVKHFGDPNLKNRPNNPKAKKSWYARHKKSLDKNPHFRAYARATWGDGGWLNKYENNNTLAQGGWLNKYK